MKKILAIILTLALTLSLAACGTNPDNDTLGNDSTSSVVSEISGDTSSDIDGDTSSDIDGDTSSDIDGDTSSDLGNDTSSDLGGEDGNDTGNDTNDGEDDEDTDIGNDEDEVIAEKITTTKFVNNTIDNRWSWGKVEVVVTEAFFTSDGVFSFTCALVNGMDHTRKDIRISHLRVADKNGVVIIDCDVTPNGQGFTLDTGYYRLHNYTFGKGLVQHTDVDLTGLSVSANVYSTAN